MDKQIKELERQLDQAESKFANAEAALRAARERLYNVRETQYLSILADRGVNVGSKVTVEGRVFGFAGFGRSHWRAEKPVAKFTKIKADGTVGKQKVYVHATQLNRIQPT